jgi:hypothetical protein
MYAGVPTVAPVRVRPTAPSDAADGCPTGITADDWSRPSPCAVGTPGPASDASAPFMHRCSRCVAGAATSGRPSARASPKSVTRAWPLASTSTLSGLKSRWTRLAAWAAARPSPAPRNTSSTSRHERGDAASHPRRVRPAASSMATNTRPPAWPTSYTATTLGCATCAIARASRDSRAATMSL